MKRAKLFRSQDPNILERHDVCGGEAEVLLKREADGCFSILVSLDSTDPAEFQTVTILTHSRPLKWMRARLMHIHAGVCAGQRTQQLLDQRNALRRPS